jgi:hypothetical protein
MRYEFHERLKDLNSVSETKPVGYLPLPTIRRFVTRDLGHLQAFYDQRGLSCKIFSAEESPIRGGAFVVFHEQAVQGVIDRQILLIQRLDWPTDSSGLIDLISTTWFDDEHEGRVLLKSLFRS